jgi:type IX secretion system PorP/SprF family membrane protein
MLLLTTNLGIMKRIKYILLIKVLMLNILSIDAQQDPLFSQYQFTQLTINPAYAGYNDYFDATLVSRHQWIGIDGAPKTQSFAISSPIKHKLGAGLSIINDQTATISNSSFQGNISYYVDIDEDTKLQFGIKAGINRFNASLVDVKNVDADDMSFSKNILSNSPLFGFGFLVSRNKNYFGFSIPNLMQTKYSDSSPFHQIRQHHFIFAGHENQINDDFKLNTAYIIRYTQSAPLSLEATSYVVYKENIWLGLSYRYKDALAALLCYDISKNIKIAYSFDYSVNALRRHNSGTHEFMLQYRIQKYVNAPYRKKIKYGLQG